MSADLFPASHHKKGKTGQPGYEPEVVLGAGVVLVPPPVGHQESGEGEERQQPGHPDGDQKDLGNREKILITECRQCVFGARERRETEPLKA